jgi:hypothetical protein
MLFRACSWFAVALAVGANVARPGDQRGRSEDPAQPPPARPPRRLVATAIHIGDTDLLIGGFMDARRCVR